MCSLFEEGALHSWIGGLVAHPLGWGLRAGSKNCQMWAARRGVVKRL